MSLEGKWAGPSCIRTARRGGGDLSLNARQGLSSVITTLQEIVLVGAFIEGSGRQSGT